MKREKWLSCLIGAVLAFGISLAGIGCLVTAFELTPVDMGAVMGICAVCAAVCAVCFCFRRGWLVLAAIAAVLIGYLLREGTLEQELESLLYKITKYYDMGYGCGTIGWSGAVLDAVPVTGGLALIGAVVAVAVSWAVCRRKSAFFAVALGFLPLAACFVVTDTIPGEGWLFLMLTCFAMLLLTQSVRRSDPKAAVRLTALLLVPVVLVAALLFRVNPQEGYTVRMEAAQQTLLNWLDGLPFVVTTPNGELIISMDGMAASQVDLSGVGPKTPLRYAVMDVEASNGGLIYLRGQSLDSYDGLSWSASAVSTGEDAWFPTRSMVNNGWISISLRSYQRRTYVPYYITEGYSLTEGYIRNGDGVMEYRFMQVVPVSEHYSLADLDTNDPILQQCLQLPEETRQKAQQLLTDELGFAAYYEETNITFNVRSRAETIRDYVAQSAQYSLDTPRMPEEETDFALWFLEQSDTGYCVHFATAATVLLRAAGIPARYVTGYTFEAQSDSRVTVRADDAHAWVEYLDPLSGWAVLDATPADWLEENDTQPPETRPVVTEPLGTEPTEVPTGTEPEPEASEAPTESQPPEETEPIPTINGGSQGQKPKADLSWLWPVLKAVLWTAGIAAVLVGQYGLRKALRRRKMKTGHHNQRALVCWQHVRLMARLIKAELPEELEFLAEKAKFSQHTLTTQELMEFELWLRQAENALLNRPWPLRLLIRLIFAV